MRVPEMEIYAREKKIALRNAGEQDAQLLLDYMKKTSEETRFLVREPEEFTMTEEQEAEFIKHINDSETDLMLLAFLDGVFIGNSSFSGMNRMRYRHRASMGIALYQKYKELADKETNVIFGGRLAEYKYYDMHHIVEKALRLFES